MMRNSPLVLDFDASVLQISDTEMRLDLREWEETTRFGASWSDYGKLQRDLRRILPDQYSCAFTGSGDFHHISLILLEHIIAVNHLGPESLDLIVCDNHPDNMRYLFGIHCGSWVRYASRLPAVRRIHVVGITSGDIAVARSWENYLGPFLRKKLFYWSIGVNADWLGLLWRKECSKSFATPQDLLEAFLPELDSATGLYLSMDKDVLSTTEVKTNWDQGVFTTPLLENLIGACAGKLLGADVCGDISFYTYQSRLKSFLAGLDGPGEAIHPKELRQAQEIQQAVNCRLASLVELQK